MCCTEKGSADKQFITHGEIVPIAPQWFNRFDAVCCSTNRNVSCLLLELNVFETEVHLRLS